MRVGDDLLDYDLVAARPVGVGNPHAEAVLRQVLDRGFQVAMRVVEESLAVGNQKLKIANLRAIDGRVVNLAEHAARNVNQTRLAVE